MICCKKLMLMIPKNSKQLLAKFNPQKAGYVLPNGNINFSNEKTAIEYAKNKILQQLQKDKTEYGVLVQGQKIIGEAKGTQNSVNIGEMERLTERFWNNSHLKRDVTLYHGHPDIYSSGKTVPLSCFEGDVELAVAAKLKSIVAYNSKGEFNRIDFQNDFSPGYFNNLEAKFHKLLEEKLTSTENLKKISELEKLHNAKKAIPDSLQQWFENFIKKQEIKTKKFLESEKYAKFMHEFYEKYMAQCGLKYSTDFNNLQ